MLVVDLSFEWDALTAAVLKARGVTHVIAYAGCTDPAKNVGKARMWDWLDNGLGVALVHENTETDDKGLYRGGRGDALAAVQAAHQLGYDWQTCVIYKAVDRDVTGADLTGVADFLRGFHEEVPVPGTYGDIQTLALARQLRYSVQWWQSDSKAYSQGQVATFAQLVQIYNHPSMAGLEADFDQYQPAAGPLRFMGGPTTMDGFTDADRATLESINRNVLGLVSQITAPSGFLARLGVNLAKTAQQIEAAGHTDTAAQLAALQGAILSVDSGGRPATPDEEHATADFVVDEFARRLGLPAAPAAGGAS